MTLTWMDALDIAAFLDSRETGVLALGKDDRGYAIPISYAYHQDDQDLYFRLGYTDRSQKREFVEATQQASFLVYDQTEEGWKSVLAIGPLVEVSETTLDSTVSEAVKAVEIPYFSVHDRSRGDLAFHTTRLDPDSLTGIAQA